MKKIFSASFWRRSLRFWDRLFQWCEQSANSIRDVGFLRGVPRRDRPAKRPKVYLTLDTFEPRLLPSVNQWANSVIGFSSQYSSGSWSAAQALGAPNTYDYGDYSTAWAPGPADYSSEFISVGFENAVYATAVTIRETSGNGFVTQIDLIDTEDAYHTIWTGTDPSTPYEVYDFQVTFAQTAYGVKGVKIYVDTNTTYGEWEEIDAIQLTGETEGGGASVAHFWLGSSAYATSESGGGFSVAVYRDISVGTASVSLTTNDITAEDPDDYSGFSTIVQFEADSTIAYAWISVEDDEIIEGDEDFGLTLSDPSDDGLLSFPSVANVVIQDDDSPPTYWLGSATYSVGESGGGFSVAVYRDTSIGTASVNLTTNDITAEDPDDYSGFSTIVQFEADSTVAFVWISVEDDEDHEGPEDFSVTLSNPSDDGLLSFPSVANVVIQDDEYLPTYWLGFASFSVSEALGGFSVAVYRDTSVGTASVNLTTNDITAEDPDDYSGFSTLVEFEAGSTVAYAWISVEDDDVFEGDEDFGLTLSDPSGDGLLSFPSVANVVIQDDESPPRYWLGSAAYSVGEAGGGFSVAVYRDTDVGYADVQLETADFSAEGGVDYSAYSSAVSFTPGSTVAYVWISIDDDGDVEPDEDFSITLSEPSLGELASPSVAIATIQDDDATISFRLATHSLLEGGGIVHVEVIRNFSEGPASVRVKSFDATALAGSDFTSIDTLLTFEDGSTVAAIDIPISNDTTAENTETFSLVLSEPSVGQTSEPTISVVTIVDDDGSFQLGTTTPEVLEGADFAVIEVRRNTTSGSASVWLRATNGTAGAGDYAEGIQRVDFIEGASVAYATIAIVDDSTSEPSETVALTLSSPSVGTLGTPISGTLTLLDNDLANPTPWRSSLFGSQLWSNPGDVLWFLQNTPAPLIGKIWDVSTLTKSSTYDLTSEGSYTLDVTFTGELSGGHTFAFGLTGTIYYSYTQSGAWNGSILSSQTASWSQSGSVYYSLTEYDSEATVVSSVTPEVFLSVSGSSLSPTWYVFTWNTLLDYVFVEEDLDLPAYAWEELVVSESGSQTFSFTEDEDRWLVGYRPGFLTNPLTTSTDLGFQGQAAVLYEYEAGGSFTNHFEGSRDETLALTSWLRDESFSYLQTVTEIGTLGSGQSGIWDADHTSSRSLTLHQDGATWYGLSLETSSTTDQYESTLTYSEVGYASVSATGLARDHEWLVERGSHWSTRQYENGVRSETSHPPTLTSYSWNEDYDTNRKNHQWGSAASASPAGTIASAWTQLYDSRWTTKWHEEGATSSAHGTLALSSYAWTQDASTNNVWSENRTTPFASVTSAFSSDGSTVWSWDTSSQSSSLWKEEGATVSGGTALALSSYLWHKTSAGTETYDESGSLSSISAAETASTTWTWKTGSRWSSLWHEEGANGSAGTLSLSSYVWDQRSNSNDVYAETGNNSFTSSATGVLGTGSTNWSSLSTSLTTSLQYESGSSNSSGELTLPCYLFTTTVRTDRKYGETGSLTSVSQPSGSLTTDATTWTWNQQSGWTTSERQSGSKATMTAAPVLSSYLWTEDYDTSRDYSEEGTSRWSYASLVSGVNQTSNGSMRWTSTSNSDWTSHEQHEGATNSAGTIAIPTYSWLRNYDTNRSSDVTSAETLTLSGSTVGLSTANTSSTSSSTSHWSNTWIEEGSKANPTAAAVLSHYEWIEDYDTSRTSNESGSSARLWSSTVSAVATNVKETTSWRSGSESAWSNNLYQLGATGSGGWIVIDDYQWNETYVNDSWRKTFGSLTTKMTSPQGWETVSAFWFERTDGQTNSTWHEHGSMASLDATPVLSSYVYDERNVSNRFYSEGGKSSNSLQTVESAATGGVTILTTINGTATSNWRYFKESHGTTDQHDAGLSSGGQLVLTSYAWTRHRENNDWYYQTGSANRIASTPDSTTSADSRFTSTELNSWTNDWKEVGTKANPSADAVLSHYSWSETTDRQLYESQSGSIRSSQTTGLVASSSTLTWSSKHTTTQHGEWDEVGATDTATNTLRVDVYSWNAEYDTNRSYTEDGSARTITSPGASVVSWSSDEAAVTWHWQKASHWSNVVSELGSKATLDAPAVLSAYAFEEDYDTSRIYEESGSSLASSGATDRWSNGTLNWKSRSLSSWTNHRVHLGQTANGTLTIDDYSWFETYTASTTASQTGTLAQGTFLSGGSTVATVDWNSASTQNVLSTLFEEGSIPSLASAPVLSSYVFDEISSSARKYNEYGQAGSSLTTFASGQTQSGIVTTLWTYKKSSDWTATEHDGGLTSGGTLALTSYVWTRNLRASDVNDETSVSDIRTTTSVGWEDANVTVAKLTSSNWSNVWREEGTKADLAAIASLSCYAWDERSSSLQCATTDGFLETSFSSGDVLATSLVTWDTFAKSSWTDRWIEFGASDPAASAGVIRVDDYRWRTDSNTNQTYHEYGSQTTLTTNSLSLQTEKSSWTYDKTSHWSNILRDEGTKATLTATAVLSLHEWTEDYDTHRTNAQSGSCLLSATLAASTLYSASSAVGSMLWTSTSNTNWTSHLFEGGHTDSSSGSLALTSYDWNRDYDTHQTYTETSRLTTHTTTADSLATSESSYTWQKFSNWTNYWVEQGHKDASSQTAVLSVYEWDENYDTRRVYDETGHTDSTPPGYASMLADPESEVDPTGAAVSAGWVIHSESRWTTRWHEDGATDSASTTLSLAISSYVWDKASTTTRTVDETFETAAAPNSLGVWTASTVEIGSESNGSSHWYEHGTKSNPDASPSLTSYLWDENANSSWSSNEQTRAYDVGETGLWGLSGASAVASSVASANILRTVDAQTGGQNSAHTHEEGTKSASSDTVSLTCFVLNSDNTTTWDITETGSDFTVLTTADSVTTQLVNWTWNDQGQVVLREYDDGANLGSSLSLSLSSYLWDRKSQSHTHYTEAGESEAASATIHSITLLTWLWEQTSNTSSVWYESGVIPESSTTPVLDSYLWSQEYDTARSYDETGERLSLKTTSSLLESASATWHKLTNSEWSTFWHEEGHTGSLLSIDVDEEEIVVDGLALTSYLWNKTYEANQEIDETLVTAARELSYGDPVATTLATGTRVTLSEWSSLWHEEGASDSAGTLLLSSYLWHDASASTIDFVSDSETERNTGSLSLTSSQHLESRDARTTLLHETGATDEATGTLALSCYRRFDTARLSHEIESFTTSLALDSTERATHSFFNEESQQSSTERREGTRDAATDLVTLSSYAFDEQSLLRQSSGVTAAWIGSSGGGSASTEVEFEDGVWSADLHEHGATAGTQIALASYRRDSLALESSTYRKETASNPDADDEFQDSVILRRDSLWSSRTHEEGSAATLTAPPVLSSYVFDSEGAESISTVSESRSEYGITGGTRHLYALTSVGSSEWSAGHFEGVSDTAAPGGLSLTCFVGDERTASTNYGNSLDTWTTASIETVSASSDSFSSLASIHREGRYSLAAGPEAISSYVADWTVARHQFASEFSHQTADAEADDRVERTGSFVWNKSVASVGHQAGAENSVGQIVLLCFVLDETFAESQSIASVYSRTLVDDDDQTHTRWTFASDSLHSFARHSAGLVNPSSGQRVLSSYAFDEWTLSSYTRTDDNDQSLESASLGYLQPEVPFESSYQRSERYALDCRVHLEGVTDESSGQLSFSSYAMDRDEAYEQTLTSAIAYRGESGGELADYVFARSTFLHTYQQSSRHESGSQPAGEDTILSSYAWAMEAVYESTSTSETGYGGWVGGSAAYASMKDVDAVSHRNEYAWAEEGDRAAGQYAVRLTSYAFDYQGEVNLSRTTDSVYSGQRTVWGNTYTTHEMYHGEGLQTTTSRWHEEGAHDAATGVFRLSSFVRENRDVRGDTFDQVIQNTYSGATSLTTFQSDGGYDQYRYEDGASDAVGSLVLSSYLVDNSSRGLFVTYYYSGSSNASGVYDESLQTTSRQSTFHERFEGADAAGTLVLSSYLYDSSFAGSWEAHYESTGYHGVYSLHSSQHTYRAGYESAGSFAMTSYLDRADSDRLYETETISQNSTSLTTSWNHQTDFAAHYLAGSGVGGELSVTSYSNASANTYTSGYSRTFTDSTPDDIYSTGEGQNHLTTLSGNDLYGFHRTWYSSGYSIENLTTYNDVSWSYTPPSKPAVDRNVVHSWEGSYYFPSSMPRPPYSLSSRLDLEGAGRYEYGWVPTGIQLPGVHAERDLLAWGATITRDEHDRIVSIEDANENLTQFSYNAVGQVIQMVDPLGHTFTQQWNSDGQLGTVINRNGDVRVFEYDDQGNEIGETWLNSLGSITEQVVFSYNSSGQLVLAANSNGTYLFDYTGDRLTSVDTPWGVHFTFGYDSYGYRTSVEDSLGNEELSSYTNTGLLLWRELYQDESLRMRITQSFNSLGDLIFQERTSFDSLGSAIPAGTSEYGYDAYHRLDDIRHLDPSDDELAHYEYTWESGIGVGFGNAPAKLLAANDDGTSLLYSYDSSGQLIGDGTSTWSFDANGNRLGDDVVIGPGNQLLADANWDYTYDPEGNLTGKIAHDETIHWTYRWNARNELIRVEKRNDENDLELWAEYAYDPFGNRIAKTVDWDGDGEDLAQTIKFVVEGFNPAKGTPLANENWDVIADLDGAGSLTTRYFRGDCVDELYGRIDSAAGPRWVLTDLLRSVRKALDADGNVVSSADYDVWGNITWESDPENRGHYAWTGRERDIEMDLQFNRGRYYDSQSGRWISQDPMQQDAGDTNLYRYASNQPNFAVDPTGFDRIAIDGNNVYWVIEKSGFFVNTEIDRILIGTKSGNNVALGTWTLDGEWDLTKTRNITLRDLEKFVGSYKNGGADLTGGGMSPGARRTVIYSVLQRIAGGRLGEPLPRKQLMNGSADGNWLSHTAEGVKTFFSGVGNFLKGVFVDLPVGLYDLFWNFFVVDVVWNTGRTLIDGQPRAAVSALAKGADKAAREGGEKAVEKFAFRAAADTILLGIPSLIENVAHAVETGDWEPAQRQMGAMAGPVIIAKGGGAVVGRLRGAPVEPGPVAKVPDAVLAEPNAPNGAPVRLVEARIPDRPPPPPLLPPNPPPAAPVRRAPVREPVLVGEEGARAPLPAPRNAQQARAAQQAEVVAADRHQQAPAGARSQPVGGESQGQPRGPQSPPLPPGGLGNGDRQNPGNHERDDDHPGITFPEWRVGNSITQRLPDGSYPRWFSHLAAEKAQTIQGRYWMNRAAAALPGEFSAGQLRSMQAGFAPTARVRVRVHATGEIEIRTVSKEIHHNQGNRGVPGFDEPLHLREVWPWEHEGIDNFRRLDYDFLEFLPE